MKQQPWLIFLRYPYSTMVVACIWVGSAAMIFIDQQLPVLAIIVIDIVSGWVITWLSYRSRVLK